MVDDKKTESRGQKTVPIVEDQALMHQTLRDFLQGAFPDCNFRETAVGARAYVARDGLLTDLIPAVVAYTGVS
jgi:hypothetical protein